MNPPHWSRDMSAEASYKQLRGPKNERDKRRFRPLVLYFLFFFFFCLDGNVAHLSREYHPTQLPVFGLGATGRHADGERGIFVSVPGDSEPGDDQQPFLRRKGGIWALLLWL